MEHFTGIQKLDDILSRLKKVQSRDEHDDVMGELFKIAPDHLEALDTLYDANTYYRMSLIWCLIGQTTIPAMALFAKAIKDKDQYTRWAAAEALTKFTTHEASTLLVAALKDRSHLVKGTAVDAMSTFCDPDAVPQLEKISRSKFLQSKCTGHSKRGTQGTQGLPWRPLANASVERAGAVSLMRGVERDSCIFIERSTGDMIMIVINKKEVVGTRGDAGGKLWRSLRLLHEEDGMGVTLTDSILEPGFEMDLWQKHHLEACYCLEGVATLQELDSGTLHQIRPGTLYAMNNHDRHRIQAKTRMRIICTFYPALTGHEVHDADGSL